MSGIPLGTIKRLMKKVGVSRISKDALEEMSKYLEEELLNITQKANESSRHAGRKTITKEDVQIVTKQID